LRRCGGTCANVREARQVAENNSNRKDKDTGTPGGSLPLQRRLYLTYYWNATKIFIVGGSMPVATRTTSGWSPTQKQSCVRVVRNWCCSSRKTGIIGNFDPPKPPNLPQGGLYRAQRDSFRFARWLTTITPPVQLMIKEGICTKDLAYRSAQNPSQARAVFQEYLQAHRIGRV
jgi:hypothetical protein